jgi:hypothetical protein
MDGLAPEAGGGGGKEGGVPESASVRIPFQAGVRVRAAVTQQCTTKLPPQRDSDVTCSGGVHGEGVALGLRRRRAPSSNSD